MHGTAVRLLINNVVVLGAATASYVVATDLGVAGPLLAGIGGCVVAGGRIPFCLYVDGVDERGPLWIRVVQGTVWSLAIFLILTALSRSAAFSAQPGQLWVAVGGLNLVSGGVTFAASVVGPALNCVTAGTRPGRSPVEK